MLRDPTSPGRRRVHRVVTRGDRLGKAIRTQRDHYNHWPPEKNSKRPCFGSERDNQS